MRFVVDANGRLRVPRPLLEAAGLQAGKAIDFELAPDGSLRIRAAPPAAGAHRLEAPARAPAPTDRLDDLLVS